MQSVSFYAGGDTPMPLGRLYTLGIRFFTGRAHAAALLPEVMPLIEAGTPAPRGGDHARRRLGGRAGGVCASRRSSSWSAAHEPGTSPRPAAGGRDDARVWRRAHRRDSGRAPENAGVVSSPRSPTYVGEAQSGARAERPSGSPCRGADARRGLRVQHRRSRATLTGAKLAPTRLNRGWRCFRGPARRARHRSHAHGSSPSRRRPRCRRAAGGPAPGRAHGRTRT